MKRINTATAVNGMFVDGNKTLGQKATQFSAEWCNAIQEELCAIVELITGAAVTGLSNHEVVEALNGDRTFRSIKVGSAELKVVTGLGESLVNLAALSAGVIEALTKFKVGGSQWVPGNGQPKIDGLYGLEAGNVGTTNLQADSLDAQSLKVGGVDVSPNTHGHGNITSAGKVVTTANKPLITGTGGVVQAGSFGSSANTFCEGNDSRLSPDADMYVAKYGVISEFTAMTNARVDGKKVCVAVGLGGGSSGFNSAEAIVPLTYVEFGSGGAVVAFYFNMPRDSYGDVNARGSILQVKCTSTGWDVTTLSPYYADTAGAAATAGSANTATSATTAGSATNATNATNDGAGSEIKSTYVCNVKLVNGGGGTLYPGSSLTVLSGATIKSDDATIGNRKYVELTYMSYGLGIGTRIQQVGEPYMTYNDPDTYLELSQTAFSIAGRKSQNEYFNALTSLLMANYHNLIEVDFDYDIVATNSTSSIGVVFCLASTLMVGTPQTTIATNDGRIFAFATVSGHGVGGHLRGHIHITGYLQSSQVITGYGLCIGARSIYGDYSGTCTLKITNVNIKDSYATYA